MGRFAIAVEFKVAVRMSVPVSTWAPAPSTVTASATPATPRCRSMLTFDPTVTTICVRRTVWKPLSSALIS